MTNMKSIFLATALAAASIIPLTAFDCACAASATTAELNRDSDAALQNLYAHRPFAKVVAEHAKAILIFPSIVKAGLVFGGAYGEGELKQGERSTDTTIPSRRSWGFQAGTQSYGYVVFLMSERPFATSMKRAAGKSASDRRSSLWTGIARICRPQR